MQSGLTISQLKVKRDQFDVEVPQLNVAPGEIVCLIGKSGSGKSTVLHALSGFMPLESGVIRRGIDEIQSLPPEKRKLALVFQQSSLFLKMTVFENTEFPLRIQNVEKFERARRVNEWLEKLGIQPLHGKKAAEISGGEAQRVQLARALITGFPVLLLDEPFSALDPSLRKDLRKLLKDLVSETKTAALFVTHDADDVLQLADRVCVMDAGKIVFQGTLKEARSSSHPYLVEILS